MATITEKTIKELDEEVDFFVNWILTQGSYKPGVVHYAGKAARALVLWVFTGEDIDKNDMPFSDFEMNQVRLVFEEKLPAHLRSIAEEKFADMQEAFAQRNEESMRRRVSYVPPLVTWTD